MEQQQSTNPIFDIKHACTDTDLLNWASVNGINAKIITLKNLNLSNKNFSRTAFIFTGSKDDEYNKNNDHHWLAQDGNLIFDSYGAYDDYKLPQNFEFFKTYPKRLQEFNSVVCGAYCCAWLKFITNQSEDLDLETLAELFKEEYGFGNNRIDNDQKVLEWYKATGGSFSSPTAPINVDTSGGQAYGGIYFSSSSSNISSPDTTAMEQ